MGNNEQKSLQIARKYLNTEVDVFIERPVGSTHPKHGFRYDANYGYIPGTTAPDGEELDAYYLNGDTPVQNGRGTCVAIIHRLDDDDDKLVVVPDGIALSDAEIEDAVRFQENWFKHEIVRQ